MDKINLILCYVLKGNLDNNELCDNTNTYLTSLHCGPFFIKISHILGGVNVYGNDLLLMIEGTLGIAL